jgi:hypothetical protein
MTRRTAACSCGQLSAQVDGEPLRISICHCLACQRRTGSVFGEQARFLTEQVQTSGTFTQYQRRGDEGSLATFHFCPRCGAIVWWKAQGLEGFITVPVGAFADPTFPAPMVSIYETRKHDWVVLPDGAEHYD